MAQERIDIPADEFFAGGCDIGIEWGSLRWIRDLPGRLGSLSPFRSWGTVPHSYLGSAMEALKPREGEPPDAGMLNTAKEPVGKIHSLLNRIHLLKTT